MSHLQQSHSNTHLPAFPPSPPSTISSSHLFSATPYTLSSISPPSPLHLHLHLRLPSPSSNPTPQPLSSLPDPRLKSGSRPTRCPDRNVSVRRLSNHDSETEDEERKADGGKGDDESRKKTRMKDWRRLWPCWGRGEGDVGGGGGAG